MPKPRQPTHAINAQSSGEGILLRSSVVSCAICGSARASASTPASPILFPASRAHRSRPSAPFAAHHTTSALTVPTPAEQRPNTRLRKAMPKPRQPTHAIKPQSAGEAVRQRTSVVSCAICGSARARRTKSANSPASHAIRKSIPARKRTRCPPSRRPPVEPTTPSRKAHPKAARTKSIPYLSN